MTRPDMIRDRWAYVVAVVIYTPVAWWYRAKRRWQR